MCMRESSRVGDPDPRDLDHAPARTRWGVTLASPSWINSTSNAIVKPCAIMEASVHPVCPASASAASARPWSGLSVIGRLVVVSPCRQAELDQSRCFPRRPPLLCAEDAFRDHRVSAAAAGRAQSRHRHPERNPPGVRDPHSPGERLESTGGQRSIMPRRCIRRGK